MSVSMLMMKLTLCILPSNMHSLFNDKITIHHSPLATTMHAYMTNIIII